MLENIKCLYIHKLIFSFLNEKDKLNLIKYNKFFQKQINIDIINYRILSGKYIIFEKKEYGKIYNAFNHKLIYEGEFLNGKKHGKGVEYEKDDKKR